MSTSTVPDDLRHLPDLSGRRVLVPGGTGGVGEGVVRAALVAGADVVVPTRSAGRAEELRAVLGAAATDHLHLVVHDYTTFAGAEELAQQVVSNLGRLDDVVAPIGGWWAGKALWEVDEHDWRSAVVDLATTHMAMLRACLPRMGHRGAYTVVVGESATTPVPGSSLVSVEQAALLMMQRVASVEAAGRQRVFALVLGPVRTRDVTVDAMNGSEGWVTPDQIGAVAVAAAASATTSGRSIMLGSSAQAQAAHEELLAGLVDAPVHADR